jgi:tetratricopeptide (TPR) repeat protein
MATLDRLVSLDPGNFGLLLIAGLVDAVGRRPAEALKVFDLLAAKAPNVPLFQVQRPFLQYMYTGDDRTFATLYKMTEAMGNFPEIGHPVALWYAGRYKEARDRLDRRPARELRFALFAYYPVFGVSGAPKEWPRGVLDLQLGDRAAAEKDGKALLAYVARQSETKWNKWFLRYLTAEGRLLQEDKAGAIEAVHEALSSSPDGGTGVWPVAPYLAATVLAMAGAKDEAATLIERVADASPCILPAEIVRNPELNTALADNARFRALKARIEAQMAANTKLFTVTP